MGNLNRPLFMPFFPYLLSSLQYSLFPYFGILSSAESKKIWRVCKNFLILQTFWFAALRIIGNPVKIRNRPATVIPTKLISILPLSARFDGKALMRG